MLPVRVISKNIKCSNDPKDVISTIKSQYFNHSIGLVIPDAMSPPSSLLRMFDKRPYFHISNIPVYEFLDFAFVTLVTGKISVTALSLKKNVDNDNCMAITPDGKLVLTIFSDVYFKLGIQGKKSIFHDSSHVITINLKNLHDKSRRKEFCHLSERFRLANDLTFNIAITWDLNEGVTDSPTIAKVIPTGYVITTCVNKYSNQISYKNLIVPTVDIDSMSEVLDWTGKIVMHCDVDTDDDSSNCIGQISHCRWTGFFSHVFLQKILEDIKKWAEERNSPFWVFASVESFIDSPVSLHGSERQYSLDGADSYVMLFQENSHPITVRYVNVSKVTVKDATMCRRRSKIRRIRRKRYL